MRQGGSSVRPIQIEATNCSSERPIFPVTCRGRSPSQDDRLRKADGGNQEIVVAQGPYFQPRAEAGVPLRRIVSGRPMAEIQSSERPIFPAACCGKSSRDCSSERPIFPATCRGRSPSSEDRLRKADGGNQGIALERHTYRSRSPSWEDRRRKACTGNAG